MSTPSEIKKYYEKHPTGEPKAERYNRIKEVLKGQHYNIILDVGCGSGYIGKTVSMLCNQFIGIDLSSKNVKIAKQSVYENGQYIICDILHLPIKPETSDVIVCSEVLEHVPNYEKAIEEFSRVSRNYGDLIITTPNYFNSSIYYRLRTNGRVTTQVYDRPIPYPWIFNCLKNKNFRVEHFRSFTPYYQGFNFTPKTLREIILKLLCFLDRIISFPLGLYILIKSKKFSV